jgi:site-specific recombinase XerD
MLTVSLQPLYHRNQESIGIYYRNDSFLTNIIKKLPGVRWSQTNKCWYVPLNPASYNCAYKALDGKAALDITLLKQYLEKRKKVVASTITPPAVEQNTTCSVPPASPAWKLSKENLEALEKFVQLLKLKAYSESTIRTYRNEFIQLLQLLKKKPVQELEPDDLRRYMVYAMEKERIKENTAHSRLNALKFYFEQVLHKDNFFWEIPRPKKPLQLPKLLNERELGKLFNALANKKHKAMLFTAYSAGLRVSEIVNLELKDIDSDRMQILIKNAKGKKDRYVNLSPVLLDILRSYLRSADPMPTKYLFESGYTADAYPIRTVQQIFSNAKNKAGITKEVGIHSLRHSFATHLLEKGTDIRFIKDLLGHFDIKTTERYLHVARQKLVNIVSPLDDLVEKGGITW